MFFGTAMLARQTQRNRYGVRCWQSMRECMAEHSASFQCRAAKAMAANVAKRSAAWGHYYSATIMGVKGTLDSR